MMPMALVEAGQGELAQLVAYHVLGDVHRDVAATIMHANGVPHHIGRDGAGARPTLDKALLVPGVHPTNLIFQVRVNVRSLFRRTGHFVSLLLTAYCLLLT